MQATTAFCWLLALVIEINEHTINHLEGLKFDRESTINRLQALMEKSDKLPNSQSKAS
jgi:hypothetical protein